MSQAVALAWVLHGAARLASPARRRATAPLGRCKLQPLASPVRRSRLLTAHRPGVTFRRAAPRRSSLCPRNHPTARCPLPAGTSCRPTRGPTSCSRTAMAPACTMRTGKSTWTSPPASPSTPWVGAEGLLAWPLPAKGAWRAHARDRWIEGSGARQGREQPWTCSSRGQHAGQAIRAHRCHCRTLGPPHAPRAGHGDARWQEAVTEQAATLAHVSNLFHTVPQVRAGLSDLGCSVGGTCCCRTCRCAPPCP